MKKRKKTARKPSPCIYLNVDSMGYTSLSINDIDVSSLVSNVSVQRDHEGQVTIDVTFYLVNGKVSQGENILYEIKDGKLS